MQESLTQLITKSVQGVDSGVKFLSEQLPDVAQQLLMYKMVQSCVIAFVCFVLLVVLNVWFLNKHIKDKSFFRDGQEGLADRGVFSWFSVVCFDIVVVSVFVVYVSQALQIYLAPKIFLIEYAAQLFK